MKSFIILPNQLFEDVKPIRKISPEIIFIVEEPFIFYCNQRPLGYNKIKLTFLVASMRYYYDYLNKNFPNTIVEYIEWSKYTDFTKKHLMDKSEVYMYDPVDFDIEAHYKKKYSVNINIIETPNFILTKEDLKEYHEKHPAKTVMGDFFGFVKKKIGVLENVPSTDKYNRLPLPRDFKNLSDYKTPNYSNKDTKRYYDFAKEYINTHKQFKSNIGSTDELTRWPITHKDAMEYLFEFLKKRFHSYGKYQDAVAKSEDDPILYHSGISPLLNNGLLDPKVVLKVTLEYGRNNNIHINNIESFIRQVAGWREYMRFRYCFYYKSVLAGNSFKSNNKFKNWSVWYYGRTGITPLDCEIRKAVKYGFSHHIVRLMMFLNIFLLLEIHPVHIYKWFMEVCAMDAYDWVMRSNIYCMGWYYPHALAKPYISTSNYILKMTQYKCDESDWCRIWDALFYRFIVTKKEHLNGSASVYLRNLHFFDIKTPQEKKEIMETSNWFISKICN